MVTAVSYKSFQELPKAKAPAVLQKLAQAVAAEGFSGIQINKELSSIDAHQETSGSGRIQTLRVVARQKGAAVRIDAVFNIQAGQIADKDVIRKGICDIIKACKAWLKDTPVQQHEPSCTGNLLMSAATELAAAEGCARVYSQKISPATDRQR